MHTYRTPERFSNPWGEQTIAHEAGLFSAGYDLDGILSLAKTKGMPESLVDYLDEYLPEIAELFSDFCDLGEAIIANNLPIRGDAISGELEIFQQRHPVDTMRRVAAMHSWQLVNLEGEMLEQQSRATSDSAATFDPDEAIIEVSKRLESSITNRPEHFWTDLDHIANTLFPTVANQLPEQPSN